MTSAVRPTFSIVIETENLTVVDLDELFGCLDSLGAQGDILHKADGVFVADAGVVPEAVLASLRERYPWVTVLRVDAGACYVELKLAGALETQSEVIVFCDGDVRYEPGWLEALLEGFRLRPDADVIAGETSTRITGPYSLAFALTFNFPRFTNEAELAPSTTYWANNFAVRRSIIAGIPIPDVAELYRGQIALHAMRLHSKSALILRQPRARAWHAVSSPSGIAQRYVHLGRDATAVRSITARESGSPYLGAMEPDRPGEGAIGRVVGRLRQVARTQPLSLLALPLAMPIMLVLGAAFLVGRLSAR
jgi:hypothetical protein